MDSLRPIKGKEDKNIMRNVVLHGVWGIDVSWKRSSCDSRKYETRDTEGKSKGGGPSPPSNHSFKVKSK